MKTLLTIFGLNAIFGRNVYIAERPRCLSEAGACPILASDLGKLPASLRRAFSVLNFVDKIARFDEMAIVNRNLEKKCGNRRNFQILKEEIEAKVNSASVRSKFASVCTS